MLTRGIEGPDPRVGKHMAKAQKVILDTDIGDDIDDALALALILASPELQLVGVTTVFGNTEARTRQARTILTLAGERFRNILVAAGCGGGMSPFDRGRRFYLERRLPNQDASCLPAEKLPALDRRHAVEFLIETILAGDGDIIPITIGAMTNLAMALVKEPKIIAKIPKVVCMAAEFKRSFSEWNIRCDPVAASIVFNSGLPVDVTTWEIGRIVHFTQKEIAALDAAERPIAKNLARAIRCWQEENNRQMPALYDPMAIATMIQPDLCTWKTGTVAVELAGQHTYGWTTFNEHADGKHRVTWGADRDAAMAFYLSRVLAL